MSQQHHPPTPENLCAAAWHNRLSDVKEILKKVPSATDKAKLLNGVNSRGQTALYCAAREGHTDIVIELLKHPQCDWNLPCGNNLSTPLHGAGFSDHPDIVALLLAKGANWNMRNTLKYSAREECSPACNAVYVTYDKLGTEALQKQFPVLSQISDKEKVKRRPARDNLERWSSNQEFSRIPYIASRYYVQNYAGEITRFSTLVSQAPTVVLHFLSDLESDATLEWLHEINTSSLLFTTQGIAVICISSATLEQVNALRAVHGFNMKELVIYQDPSFCTFDVFSCKRYKRTRCGATIIINNHNIPKPLMPIITTTPSSSPIKIASKSTTVETTDSEGGEGGEEGSELKWSNSSNKGRGEIVYDYTNKEVDDFVPMKLLLQLCGVEALLIKKGGFDATPRSEGQPKTRRAMSRSASTNTKKKISNSISLAEKPSLTGIFPGILNSDELPEQIVKKMSKKKNFSASTRAATATAATARPVFLDPVEIKGPSSGERSTENEVSCEDNDENTVSIAGKYVILGDNELQCRLQELLLEVGRIKAEMDRRGIKPLDNNTMTNKHLKRLSANNSSSNNNIFNLSSLISSNSNPSSPLCAHTPKESISISEVSPLPSFEKRQDKLRKSDSEPVHKSRRLLDKKHHQQQMQQLLQDQFTSIKLEEGSLEESLELSTNSSLSVTSASPVGVPSVQHTQSMSNMKAPKEGLSAKRRGVKKRVTVQH